MWHLGEEVGSQAVLGVVGQLDGLLIVLEAEQRHCRAEGLLAEDLHVYGRVGQHCGRVEVSLQVIRTRDQPDFLVLEAAHHRTRVNIPLLCLSDKCTICILFNHDSPATEMLEYSACADTHLVVWLWQVWLLAPNGHCGTLGDCIIHMPLHLGRTAKP